MTYVRSIEGGRPWTPEEDIILRHMLADDKTRREIAKVVGRSTGSVDSRAAKLKLTKTPRFRVRPEFHKHSPGLRTAELGRPLDLGEGDYRYVEACLRQGGFASSTRVKGKLIFGHNGRAWVQP